MRPIQKFSEEYIKYCQKLTPEQIVEFMEDFRLLNAPEYRDKSILISLKIPQALLRTFRQKCEVSGSIKYQTQIKNLMKQWVQFSTE